MPSNTTTQVQFRRGNSFQSSTFAGVSGEITVNTDTYQISVHDGNGTLGGWTGARIYDLNNASGFLQSQLNYFYNIVVYQTGQQIISGQKSFANGIYTIGGVQLIDSNNYLLNNQYGQNTVDFNNLILYSYAQPVIDWKNALQYDVDLVHGQKTSIDFGNRLLYSRPSNSTIYNTLDWQNSILYGNWNIKSGNFNENISYNFTVTGNNNNFNLSNKPLYFNTGTSVVNWILPSISQNIGRQYIIKNKGNTINLSGTYPDYIFSNQRVLTLSIISGSSYTIINDGINWSVL